MTYTHREILSAEERKMLQSFLEGKEQSASFRVLKHRIKNYNAQLHQDLNLIDEASKKFEK